MSLAVVGDKVTPDPMSCAAVFDFVTSHALGLEAKVCGGVGTTRRFMNQAKLSIEHEHISLHYRRRLSHCSDRYSSPTTASCRERL
jgi:hypothetical protein